MAGDRVAVLLSQGDLTLSDASAGEADSRLVWPLAEIARMRVGYEETKLGKYHQTLIWRTGEPHPIMLCPDRADLAAYAATIRQLAADLAAPHGPGRVERGIGGGAAVVLLVLVGLVALIAYAIALFVMVNEPWWGRLILVAVASGVLGLVVWDYRANKRPMAVEHLAELDRQLPR